MGNDCSQTDQQWLRLAVQDQQPQIKRYLLLAFRMGICLCLFLQVHVVPDRLQPFLPIAMQHLVVVVAVVGWTLVPSSALLQFQLQLQTMPIPMSIVQDQHQAQVKQVQVV
jgi:hypothetical protein